MNHAPAAAGRRIGLFGGSFDPVHRAHLAFARSALAQLALDEVRWVPAGQPWQKARTLSEARHRVAMLELATAGEPRFVIEDIELERSGPSYTLDTVQALQAREPGAHWVLLIGQDQYAGLHSWHRWRELLAEVELAVAARPGVAPAAEAEVACCPHAIVPLAMDVSATEIRRRAANGQDITELVPPQVARYIDQHALYRAASGS
ncbi:nicotinate (nicotinamide) nucleotide adenylyltransferase [Rubrivivax gelatinosus]|uniref:Probable nicotinate-nucleotide adenylyltransferase n=1 Tax=Rubrivivax gelatinosus TaxID=28068 RepID=A0ABS1DW51_RUBGE|nr:nicotinate (nicotinamide) nucleotide adenylyltransferase [Rubrivivax gelatinosus]MBK1714246.1 nicotinate (nicotinamide) nucleotide adenylyltransferase [Rubrivivax gelatinosus]